jgi:tetratricopeptide (TPR) repeat protein
MRIAALLLSTLLLAGTAVAAPKQAARPAPNEIDSLFSALAKAESADEAKPIEEKILTAFLHSGSATVDLLMTRAATVLHAGDTATGQKLIAAVTNVAPDYAEGWHQRAEMLAAAGDDQGAMFCLQKTITLNPRHFEALAELASKVEEYGDKPAALRLYRKALALDPQMEGIARTIRGLEHEVEGESL